MHNLNCNHFAELPDNKSVGVDKKEQVKYCHDFARPFSQDNLQVFNQGFTRETAAQFRDEQDDDEPQGSGNGSCQPGVAPGVFSGHSREKHHRGGADTVQDN
ncbi:MAG: hypothetical protein BWY65_02345 [Firmicutes bacterium ADurb.Bin373]|nr:MAG: hypothetical protein BWY65_02345 [Firmicutes bacterium ADurb.Bin373]